MSLTFFYSCSSSSRTFFLHKKLLVISGYLRDNIFWHYCTLGYNDVNKLVVPGG
jgi:hypothetical protein